MEENKGWTEETNEEMEEMQQEAQPEEPGMGFFEKLTGIYIDPVNTLKAISRRPEFWVPLVVITIVTVAFGAYNLEAIKSAQMGDMAFRAQAGGPEVSGEPSAARILISSLISTPIGLLIGWAIGAGILCLIVMIMGGSFRFKDLYSLMAWTSMPNVFKTAVAGFVMHGKEFSSSYEMGMSQASGTVGLGLFVTGTDYFSLLLGQIDVFLIWGFFLLMFGLPYFSSLKKQQAVTTAVVFNVIILLAMTGVMYMGIKFYESALERVS
jgi:hypothetical protein